jgi:hypothetical protein
MKRFLLLAALFATSSISFAQWRNSGPNNNGNGQYGYNNSALVINTATNQQFNVVIDNGYQYQGNGSALSIPNINPGNHTVTVYEYKRNIFGSQRQKILYSSNLYFKPGTEHLLYINQFGQASFDERPLYQNGNYGNNGQYGNNGNGKGWGYGRMKNKHHKQEGCDRDNNDDRDNNRRGNW